MLKHRHHRGIRLYAAWMAGIWLIAGCGIDTGSSVRVPPTTNAEHAPADGSDRVPAPAIQFANNGTPGQGDGLGDYEVQTGDPVEVGLAPPPPRPLRRLDIDQLSRSFKAVAGVGWTSPEGADLFEVYSATLGKPDYMTTTLEDAAPGALFQKFLGDAANNVCNAWLADGDPAHPFYAVAGAQTATWPGDEALIRSNIEDLTLRAHGRRPGPDDPGVTQSVRVFQRVYGAASQNPTTAAWRATCVWLFLHPDFYTL